MNTGVTSRFARRFGAAIATLALAISLPMATVQSASAEELDPDTIPTKDNGIPFYMNDWNCRSKVHPVPVVMVHGTFSSQRNQIDVTHMLWKLGYCVFGTNLGQSKQALITQFEPDYYGTDHVNVTTDELRKFLRQVEKRTGSPQVDLIGHSQGGLIIRNYITRYGGHDVRIATLLAGTQNGSTMSGLATLAQAAFPTTLQEISAATAGPALYEQMSGSSFMNDINKHPNTKAGITYVVLVTPDDTQATPWRVGYLTNPVPGARVFNINVKALCHIPADEEVDHSDVHKHPGPLSIIRWGLKHSLDKGAIPRCWAN